MKKTRGAFFDGASETGWSDVLGCGGGCLGEPVIQWSHCLNLCKLQFHIHASLQDCALPCKVLILEANQVYCNTRMAPNMIVYLNLFIVKMHRSYIKYVQLIC